MIKTFESFLSESKETAMSFLDYSNKFKELALDCLVFNINFLKSNDNGETDLPENTTIHVYDTNGKFADGDDAVEVNIVKIAAKQVSDSESFRKHNTDAFRYNSNVLKQTDDYCLVVYTENGKALPIFPETAPLWTIFRINNIMQDIEWNK